jgi:DNA-directed RNA polymerase specialized sigma24 family protein
LIDHFAPFAPRKYTDIDDWAEQLWVDNDNEARDASRDVHQLLSELPDKQRLPIEHTKLQGLSIAEAAQLTGRGSSYQSQHPPRARALAKKVWSHTMKPTISLPCWRLKPAPYRLSRPFAPLRTPPLA